MCGFYHSSNFGNLFHYWFYQTIAGVIVQQMVATGSAPPSPPSTPAFIRGSSTPISHHSGSRTSSSDIHRYGKDRRVVLSPPNGVLDDALFAEVKVYYCSQVYDAVLISIGDSLSSLYESVHWSSKDIDK